MAHVDSARHIFHIPPARVRSRRELASVFRKREHVDLIDLEFSNYGRNPRFQPGWYILPAVVTGMAMIAAVLLLV
jgi:hypothetical protein